MDFEYNERTKTLLASVSRFVEEEIIPSEALFEEQVLASGDKHHHPQKLADLKAKAKARGLWNLFLPNSDYGAGLNNAEYAPLCEAMGRSLWAAEVFNCSAPDTGNMEILAEFGTLTQKERWLKPLLEGEIRSCFSMTEPDSAGSDPTLLRTQAVREGDTYVINGHKWFTSNAAHPHSKLIILMAVTNPDAPPHRRASQILLPMDAEGIEIIRPVPVFNDDGGHGHCEVRYRNVRVPVTSVLGEEGAGFAISQARLGPGRIHHCMRAIGGAERALKMMGERATTRYLHGAYLADQGVIQDWIAQSRMEIDQARLLVLYAAWKMDTYGKKEARQEIAMVKVAVANVFTQVVDRAIQIHGAMGFTNDTPLAKLYAYARTMRVYDGADEVHKMVIARRELRQYAHLRPQAPPLPVP